MVSQKLLPGCSGTAPHSTSEQGDLGERGAYCVQGVGGGLLHPPDRFGGGAPGTSGWTWPPQGRGRGGRLRSGAVRGWELRRLGGLPPTRIRHEYTPNLAGSIQDILTLATRPPLPRAGSERWKTSLAPHPASDPPRAPLSSPCSPKPPASCWPPCPCPVPSCPSLHRACLPLLTRGPGRAALLGSLFRR